MTRDELLALTRKRRPENRTELPLYYAITFPAGKKDVVLTRFDHHAYWHDEREVPEVIGRFTNYGDALKAAWADHDRRGT